MFEITAFGLLGLFWTFVWYRIGRTVGEERALDSIRPTLEAVLQSQHRDDVL